MRAGTFVVKLGTLGPERVVVNGQEVTDLVEWVNLLSQHGQAPAVRLGLKAGVASETISGDGVIEVEPSTFDAARWLANIDAELLDQEVMERLAMSGMGGVAPPIQTALAVLREWASGAGA